MSGLLSGLGNALPMAGAAAGGYAQGHVQKQQLDGQKREGDARQLLMALQAAAAQRDAAPVSDEWQQSMQTNAPGFAPVQGGSLQDQAIPYQAFAASESARKQAAFNAERSKLGVDKAGAATARQSQKDGQWQADHDLKKRQVTVQERALKLNAIRAMKITDPKVLRFMNRGPAEKAAVIEANQNGVLGDLLSELYNREKWDPDEGSDVPGDDDEPPMPQIKPATRR